MGLYLRSTHGHRAVEQRVITHVVAIAARADEHGEEHRVRLGVIDGGALDHRHGSEGHLVPVLLCDGSGAIAEDWLGATAVRL